MSRLVGSLRAHPLEVRAKFGNNIYWRRLAEYLWCCFHVAVWWKGQLRSPWKPLLKPGSSIGMGLFWHFRPWPVGGDQVSKYVLSLSDLKNCFASQDGTWSDCFNLCCSMLRSSHQSNPFYEASQVARILQHSSIAIANGSSAVHLIAFQFACVCMCKSLVWMNLPLWPVLCHSLGKIILHSYPLILL